MLCYNLSVLSKVRDFLPQMASANNELRSKMELDPDFSADIEQLDEEQSSYIQMVVTSVHTTI